MPVKNHKWQYQYVDTGTVVSNSVAILFADNIFVSCTSPTDVANECIACTYYDYFCTEPLKPLVLHTPL